MLYLPFFVLVCLPGFRVFFLFSFSCYRDRDVIRIDYDSLFFASSDDMYRVLRHSIRCLYMAMGFLRYIHFFFHFEGGVTGGRVRLGKEETRCNTCAVLDLAPSRYKMLVRFWCFFRSLPGV